MKLLYGPAIPLRGAHPKEVKTGPQTDTCTGMFIATLFSIVKR